MMLRGGRGGRGSGSRQGGMEEQQKMSIGVDPRTNSIIVAAPDALFQEVKELVEQLDLAAIDSNETLQVVTLHRASPDAVQRALGAMMGSNVQIGRSASSGSPPPSPGGDFSSPWSGRSRRSMSPFPFGGFGGGGPMPFQGPGGMSPFGGGFPFSPPSSPTTSTSPRSYTPRSMGVYSPGSTSGSGSRSRSGSPYDGGRGSRSGRGSGSSMAPGSSFRGSSSGGGFPGGSSGRSSSGRSRGR